MKTGCIIFGDGDNVGVRIGICVGIVEGFEGELLEVGDIKGLEEVGE